MSKKKIELIFTDLKNEVITENEAFRAVIDLFTSSEQSIVDTSDIVVFAAKHQKEYGKDISFVVSKEGNEIVVVMQTVFGKFTGKGHNQKIAKVEAVKLANEAWE